MKESTAYKQKKELMIIAAILFVSLCFNFYLYHIHTKIAFVRTEELIFSYNGMREARETYKTQTDIWQANIDTLRMQYQKCLADYQSSQNTLSEKERVEKQNLIKKLEDNLKNYSTVIQNEAQKKEKSMTEEVLNQINSYVEAYAKQKGYDFVISGTNGNLLYGSKSYDITDEVVQALNKEYKFMPSQSIKTK